jgi:hypothetical protein
MKNGIHSHFCSDCDKAYECHITEPCHLYTAELCLRHYLIRQQDGAVYNAIFNPWRRHEPKAPETD